MSLFTKTAAKEQGFTLVESLIAISILMLAIAGPLVAVSNAISQSGYARDQVTAFYLAQDAVEYLRNLRDTNVLGQQEWDATMKSYFDTDFALDTTQNDPTNAFLTCAGGCANVHPMYYDVPTGEYIYQQTNQNQQLPSIYTRTIHLTQVSAKEIAIQVTISWQPAILTTPKTFTIQEDITNWVQL